MSSAKTHRRGSILITLGALLIIGALGLTGYNIWDSNRAGEASSHISQGIAQARPDTLMAAPTFVLTTDAATPEMPTVEIDGYDYIGNVQIPEMGIDLPVMNDWDYNRLYVSPCRYVGSYFTDDMVICAHNYASHFGPVRDISIGAEVNFVTVDGYVYRYKVSNVETVQPTSIDKMIGTDGTGDGWDLSLFTCHTGGQTRCAVRCIRVKD